MTDVATNFPPENLSLIFFLQGEAEEVISIENFLLPILFSSITSNLDCLDDSGVRIFHNFSEYRSNTITFDPSRIGFQGNHVDFKSASVLELKKNIFKTFDSNYISALLFHHKGIEELEEGAFQFLDSLQNLDLHTNKIRYLRNGVFDGLNKLIRLDVGENLIEEIDPFAFNPTKSLRFLNLSKNKLRSIDGNFLWYLKHLKKLDLSYNELSSISDTAFDHLVSLEELFLNSNNFITLNPEQWLNVINLYILDVSDNSLTTLDTHYSFSFKNLTYLSLNGNLLVKLDAFRLVINIPNLTLLGIERNRWRCSDLSSIISTLKKGNINYRGTEKNDTQIDGISCTNEINNNFNDMEEMIMTISSENYNFKESPEELRENKVFKSITQLRTIVRCILVVVVLVVVAGVVYQAGIFKIFKKEANHSSDDERNAETIPLLSM